MDIGEQIQLFQDFFELNYYDDIIKAIQNRIQEKRIFSENIYGDGKSGNRIADVLATIPMSFHKTITYHLRTIIH